MTRRFKNGWSKNFAGCVELFRLLMITVFVLLLQVQVLRTINSDSAKFSKEDNSFLYSLKGRRTEDSIQRGYVHHIRRAQRFIYIENQYFLGSSHLWLDDAHNKARTMIPYEIAKAICRKIAERKRFAVYIVMPLFPEGDPSSAALQVKLYSPAQNGVTTSIFSRQAPKL